MSDAKITCKYSCHLCGLKAIEVAVPARGDEDVISWMKALGKYLSEDHHAKSPHCRPDTLSNVMIPITGANKVGGPMLS